ncbi:MAG: histidinol-phosphate transaminase [Betaproteobacteria bacterium]|nr:histidinol-phosphate transaminase [Gammaproteobacteria bacterium]MDH3436019.1 histidinol-phosphate transaminase [Betaproteobacteria bacterium]
MDICDLAPSYIREIAPYQPGKPISELARELGLEEARIVKLASNENPLGVSPRAQDAIGRVFADLARYPDGNGFELKQALAGRYGVDESRIVLGNGSNDVLELAARVFLCPGQEAIYSQHAFAVYPLVVQATGARGVEVPAREFGHDLDAMQRAVTSKTRLVFIANPNNPTGTLLSAEALEKFISALSRDVVVVLDEAYNEYLEEAAKADSLGWLKRFSNLIVTRTFSKVYGLAGLRVGYAFAAAGMADLMNRVRQPFNVNSVALVAATAALEDHEFVRQSFELNRAGMKQITAGLKRLEIEFIPSFGNFVSLKVGDGAAVFDRLLRMGVIARPIASYGMPAYLRVTIGLESENARFLAALEEVIAT